MRFDALYFLFRCLTKLHWFSHVCFHLFILPILSSNWNFRRSKPASNMTNSYQDSNPLQASTSVSLSFKNFRKHEIFKNIISAQPQSRQLSSNQENRNGYYFWNIKYFKKERFQKIVIKIIPLLTTVFAAVWSVSTIAVYVSDWFISLIF